MNLETIAMLLKEANKVCDDLKYKPSIVYDNTHGVCLVISIDVCDGYLITLKNFNWDDIPGEVALAKAQIDAIIAANGKKASENSENRESLPDSGS